MKKYSILFIAFILASCSSYKPVTHYIDYSKYQKEGLFITESNSPQFDYTPVGSIQLFVPARYKVHIKTTNIKFDTTAIKVEKIRMNHHRGNFSIALDKLVEKAQAEGANGIINLKYEVLPESKTNHKGYLVTGMAIKK